MKNYPWQGYRGYDEGDDQGHPGEQASAVGAIVLKKGWQDDGQHHQDAE
ncbi:MAG TPA: hypothetical protein V6D29_25655 [Leptolyngbyaceae cyanobacterium]